ncbi:MAG: EamA family transporter [Spirochaetales bacterium]|nr:EamA family transporter [Spirochaetales bacterium]
MTVKSASGRKAELLLILTTLIWGGTFAVIKNGLSQASPLILMGFRFTLACLVFGIIFHRSLGRISRQVLRDGSILGLLMFISYSLQTLGLEHTTASRSGFITYSFALFTPPLQLLILKRKPALKNLIGLIVVFGGLFFISKPESGSFNKGDLMTLICAISLAFYVIYLDLMSKRSNTFMLTVIQFFICGGLSFLLAPFVEKPRLILSGSFIISILYLGILGSVVGIALMIRFQKELSPTKAVIIYGLEPLFSVMVAILFLTEQLSPVEWAGCALIFIGVLISELQSDRIGIFLRKTDKTG